MSVEELKVICQVCDEVVGLTTREELHLPLDGSMFHSKDERHDFPRPWADGTEWEWMQCPYGRHRFSNYPNEVLTDQGVITVEEREPVEMEETPPAPDTEEIGRAHV
jgi:hypothetical protein